MTDTGSVPMDNTPLSELFLKRIIGSAEFKEANASRKTSDTSARSVASVASVPSQHSDTSARSVASVASVASVTSEPSAPSAPSAPGNHRVASAPGNLRVESAPGVTSSASTQSSVSDSEVADLLEEAGRLHEKTMVAVNTDTVTAEEREIPKAKTGVNHLITSFDDIDLSSESHDAAAESKADMAAAAAAVAAADKTAENLVRIANKHSVSWALRFFLDSPLCAHKRYEHQLRNAFKHFNESGKDQENKLKVIIGYLITKCLYTRIDLLSMLKTTAKQVTCKRSYDVCENSRRHKAYLRFLTHMEILIPRGAADINDEEMVQILLNADSKYAEIIESIDFMALASNPRFVGTSPDGNGNGEIPSSMRKAAVKLNKALKQSKAGPTRGRRNGRGNRSGNRNR